MERLIEKLGPKFGVLAESDTTQLKVMAKNEDVAVGDLFILPSRRGHERFYIFRTAQYANVMNRTIDMGDVARNKLTMPDSYLSDDLYDEKLIELKGMLLGYAQRKDNGQWSFHRPRRLPEHLTDVFLVKEDNSEVIKELLLSQLGDSGLFIGYLLAGEKPLLGVPVYMPPYAISHHIGIFGRTGCGKSNLMMVLIESMIRYNEKVNQDGAGQKVSMLAIDPHDEFCHWPSGCRGGIAEIVGAYSPKQWEALVEPFYYLTAKDTASERGQRQIRLSRADVVPQDLFSIMEFSEQQVSFANQFYARQGEIWISRILSGDLGEGGATEGTQFLPGTISAVERRVNFLRRGQTQVLTPFDPAIGDEYNSLLPEIVCALESGRIITVDTTLMNEMEQFLFTTVVARALFSLRKALKSSHNLQQLEREIGLALGYDPDNSSVGMRAFAERMVGALADGSLPYIKDGRVARVEELPAVNVVIEEAPSVLNPDRLRFGSVFRDISRQGRKFGIGLTVISQQVSAIDQGILTQLNTEIILALGNENERREAIRNASADLYGFEKELQVMGKGQAILTASYRDVPLPVQAPLFDDMGDI
jgi:DNA helicase HerA-like ATPase